MKPTASQLAGRDAARAALLGAFDGATFGAERSPFGADEMGADDMGFDYDDDLDEEEDGPFAGEVEMAGEFGGRRHRRQRHQRGATHQVAPTYPAQPMRPRFAAPVPQQQAPRLTAEERQALWEMRHRKMRTAEKRRELFPNEGSDIKLNKASFSLINQGPDLILGTSQPITYSGMPDEPILPKRVIMNAPVPGFITINEIKVGSRALTLGGSSDAFEYSPLAQDTSLEFPIMGRSTRATVLAQYNGFYTENHTKGNKYVFTVTLQGKSKISV